MTRRSSAQHPAGDSRGFIDSVRLSRNGDRFHYIWAATRLLRLLDLGSRLQAIAVEGTGTIADDSAVGAEAIDIAEFYGPDRDSYDEIIIRQFKYSTVHADKNLSVGDLGPTLRKFAQLDLTRSGSFSLPDSVALRFSIVSNRPTEPALRKAIQQIAAGQPAAPNSTAGRILGHLEMSAEQAASFCSRLSVDDDQPSLSVLRSALDVATADLAAGINPGIAAQLIELIAKRASTEADGPVRDADVIVAFGVEPAALTPAPSLLASDGHVLARQAYRDLADAILATAGLLLITAEGGVGKSTFATMLPGLLSDRAQVIVYDCFGNGTYRASDGSRHRHEDGLVQIATELAGAELCLPVLPQRGQLPTEYMKQFNARLLTAITALREQHPGRHLVLLIDAADNAAMEADARPGDQAFTRDLLRLGSVPEGVHIALTCRPERRHLLKPPPSIPVKTLAGFSQDESASLLRATFPGATDLQVEELHARTSGNPRLQALALEAVSLDECLATLTSANNSAGDTLQSFLADRLDETLDAAPDAERSALEKVGQLLATLRPSIPISVVSTLCGQSESFIRSFVADIGRGLLIEQNTVQFLDEPTETFFRHRYPLAGAFAAELIEALTELASADAYAAASLPQVLWEARQYDQLLRLAASEAALPASTHVEKAQIAHLRTQFALRAAVQLQRPAEVVQLAMLAGAVGASHERRYRLLRDHPDLTGDSQASSTLDEMLSARLLPSDWPGSAMSSEAVMLSMSDDRRGWASSRTRSALDVLAAYSRRPRDSHGTRITAQQLAFAAHAVFNIKGPEAAASYLEGWRPADAVLESGVHLTRVLLSRVEATRVEQLMTAAQTPALCLAVAAEFHRLGLPLGADAAVSAWQALKGKRIKLRTGMGDYELEDALYRGLGWIGTSALRHHVATRRQLTALLNRYLPKDPPYGLGDRFGSARTGILHAYALRNELAGTALTIEPFRPQPRTEGRRDADRARRNDDGLRRYLEPALPWLSGWAKWVLDSLPDAERSALVASYPSKRSSFESPSALRRVAAPIIAQLVRTSTSEADAANFSTVLASAVEHSGAHRALEMIACLRGDPRFASEALRCASAANVAISKSEEELADSLADDIVAISRAIRPYSEAEAQSYFDAAIEFASRVGEDIWRRWEAIVALAARARGDDADNARRLGARVARDAEAVRPFMGDYFNEADLVSALAALAGPHVLAILSQWRDRDFGDLGWQLQGLSDDPRSLLRLNPKLGIAFAPFTTRPHIPTLLRDLAATGELEPEVVRTAKSLQHRLGHSLSHLDLDFNPESVGTEWDPPRAPEIPKPTRASGMFDDERIATERLTAEQAFRAHLATLDLTTQAGAVAAIADLDTRFHELETLTDMAFSLPETDWSLVVRTFAETNLLPPWQMGKFLKSAMQRASNSHSFRNELRAAVHQFIRANATDIALGQDYSLDRGEVAALLDTDLRGVLMIALADINSEEVLEDSERCYRLAAGVAELLTPAEAAEALEAALIRLEGSLDVEYSASAGGETLASMDTASAVAGFLWAALGDPRAKTRWRATHAVRTLLELRQVDVIDAVQAAAMNGALAGFTDPRFPFYEMHAANWLLIAIDRVAKDDPQVAAILLPAVQELGERHRDHASIQHLCHLIAARSDPDGTPLGTDWPALLQPPVLLPSWERPHIPKPFSHEAVKTEVHFHFDLEEFLLADLTSSFEIDHQAVMDALSRQILDEWHWRGAAALEHDPRRVAGAYRDGETYFYKSDYPEAEDLNFYLSYHAAQTVAGKLLRSSRPYQDPADEEPDIVPWMQRFDLSRADRNWISDTRRPVPASLSALVPDNPGAQWEFQVAPIDFEEAIQTESGWVTVWQSAEGSRYETQAECNIRSALVAPDAASSLLKSLQTADDFRSYRLPHSDDEDYTFDQSPFRLRGWIQEPYSEAGADRRDPFARHLQAPLPSPAPWVIETLGLAVGATGQDWIAGTDLAATFKAETWADKDQSPDPHGHAGHRVRITEAGLDELLRQTDMALIIEVVIRRRDPHHRRSQDDSSEEGLGYFATYVKLFTYEPGFGWRDYLGRPCTGYANRG